MRAIWHVGDFGTLATRIFTPVLEGLYRWSAAQTLRGLDHPAPCGP
jgi:hypothetical protein